MNSEIFSNLLIFTSIIAIGVLVIVSIIVHFHSISLVGGYRNYLRNLKILRKYNEISNKKFGYFIFYNKEFDCIKSFIITNENNILVIDCVNSLSLSTDLKIYNYNNESGVNFESSIYDKIEIPFLQDFIYKYYYNKFLHKIKEGDIIKCTGYEDSMNKIRELILLEYREKVLELLLSS